jgi:hypothetical protein
VGTVTVPVNVGELRLAFADKSVVRFVTADCAIEIAVFDAAVNLPLESTVNVGTALADPYEAGVTAVFTRVEETDASAPPLNEALPVTSPVNAIALEVVRVAAEPVVLALMVEGRDTVMAPEDAETSTSFVVPAKDSTPVFENIVPSSAKPVPAV